MVVASIKEAAPSSGNSTSSSHPPPPPPSSSSPPSHPPPPPSSSSPPPPPPKSDDDSSSSSSSPPKDSNSKSPPPPPSSSDNEDDYDYNDTDKDKDKDNDNSSKGKYGPPTPSSWDHAPPPPRHSPAIGSSSSSKDSNSGMSNNTKAMVAGVAAGVALLLIFMLLFLVSCAKRKKRKPHDPMNYYRDNSEGNSTNYYLSSQNNSTWSNPQGMMGKVPPHPGGIDSMEHGGWGPPPPPPPMMYSSEISSNYSGPHQPPMPPPHPSLALGFNKSTFSYEDLAAATGGFAKGNMIGQGGFGYVYRGVLPNGKEVAVKALKAGSGQGEREFQAEVDIISRVHHRHLVSLVGYCIVGEQRMLVYEFVPNNTLEYHLHGKDRPTMDWPTRLRIALGAAKGFAYLHEDCHPRIIHRDIKAANILIDESFEAKVADFGLAKLSSDNYTHVSTRIMGTFGYLAPEYAASGKLTEKSDVYSYGVMLLELITGRRPVNMHSDEDSLVDWSRPVLMRVAEGGGYDELVDPKLGDNYHPHEMLRMVSCAAACIRHSAKRRPKMSQIVRALEGDVSLDDLHDGGKTHGSTLSSGGGSEIDLASYNAEMKMFRKSILTSEEFTGEHYTGDHRAAAHPPPPAMVIP